MNNPLAKNFGFLSLLKFTAPTIIMMVFMSMYCMVDGVFVSNFVGETALSSVNIVFPIQSIIIAIAIMFATGGSAIIAKKMGEGKAEEAKANFTQIVIVGTAIGFVVTLVGLTFIRPIIHVLGSTPVLDDYCLSYLRILLLFAPFSVLQMLFQFFFITAGKPRLGLFGTIAGGVANVVLDFIFIVFCDMGIAGAAWGTVIGNCIPAVFGLIYFTYKRRGSLCFVKPSRDMRLLWHSCQNGSSEMVTNLANAVTTFLFNVVMIRHLGENGVSAITIVLYSQFLLTSVYLGFSSGVAPVISYHYGEQNHSQLKKIYKISLVFILISSVLIFVLSTTLSAYIVEIFVNLDSPVFPLAKHGFLLFSISYLFTGINIYASALFTAFSNGKISAVIAFLRTFVFIVLTILLLPLLIGVDGVWLSVPIAELITLSVSIAFLLKFRHIYQYG